MFLNKNSAAAMINLIWPITAALWLFTPDTPKNRVAQAALIALMFFAVGLTGSRGAALAALAGLILIAVIGFFLVCRHRATLAFVVIALTALGLSNLLTSETIIGGARTLADPGSAGATRFVIWSQAWAMIQQHPWLGYGPGVFYLAYPAFRLPADGSAGYFVHNDYLEFWLERGLPGLLLVLAIIVACAWLFWRHCRSVRGDGEHTPLSPSAVGAFTALATVATHSLFSYSLQMMPFLLVVGFRIGELERAVAAAPAVRVPIPNLRRPLPAVSVAAVTLLGLWAFAVHALYFDRVDRGIRHAQYGEYAQAVEHFRKARALWSLPDSAWYLQANTHYMALQRSDGLTDKTRKQLVDKAIGLLDSARQRNSVQPAIPLLLGLYRANFPDLTSGSAHHAFRRALELDPRTIEARYALSQLLERQGRREQALEVVKQGLGMPYKRGIDITPLVERVRVLEGDGATAHGPKDFAAPSLE
jgi:tetratricopeptide (TPR) repeat protein